jgi:OmpA-OmpF porin, OOP family
MKVESQAIVVQGVVNQYVEWCISRIHVYPDKIIYKFRKMRKLIVAFVLILFRVTTVSAQDAEGCKEHPFFSRMPNFFISGCSQKFDKLEYYTSESETTSKEGELTIISYSFPEDASLKVPSQLQIIRNYENAILRLGGKKIYVDTQYLAYSLKKNSKDYIICVIMSNGNISHDLCVLEISEMVQEITANDMLDALNKDGFVPINVLFETGKSTIQEESLPVIDQVYELLNSNTALKVSVEGHTDNVGDAVSNKALSKDRAKAIMDALIAKGIDKSRLSSVGWGQEKPIADNRTEEGRAKNRRVEIVRE